MTNGNLTIALLIDSENVSAKYMSALDKELILFGKVTYKRMYGDFTGEESKAWKTIVNDYSITPVQQFSYTKGKNATDSKLIIDAMDILYSGNINGVCLMSSDSDFTGLAKRLKESNIFVIGAGEKKTPSSFVKVCDRFLYLEDIAGKDSAQKKKPSAAEKKEEKPKKKTKKEAPAAEESVLIPKEDIENFAVHILEGQEEKGSLEWLISKIYQAYPQFDFKAYGAKKSYEFFSKEKFEIEKGKESNMFIKLKET